MIRLDNVLVAQVETRGEEKIDGNGGKERGEDDGTGIHGGKIAGRDWLGQRKERREVTFLSAGGGGNAPGLQC